MLLTLFLSHGAPTLPLDDCPARDFLKTLGENLPRPKAVLVASAHWDNASPFVNAVAVNETIHDFYGFPKALYEMQYRAPGSHALAQRTAEVLAAAGFKSGVDGARGLDHGAWVPLMLMYPEAGIPVVQLSIQTPLGPEHHLRLGKALAPLRAEDVLIVGSGSFTHNLRAMDRGRLNGPEAAWSQEFSDWIHAGLSEGRMADLLAYRRLAPHGVQAHPSEDHFLPLFVALGAGGAKAKPERLHRSATFGSLRMDAYAFH